MITSRESLSAQSGGLCVERMGKGTLYSSLPQPDWDVSTSYSCCNCSSTKEATLQKSAFCAGEDEM